MAGLIKHCTTTSKLTAAYLGISILASLIVYNFTHLIIYIRDNLLTIAISLVATIGLGILLDGDHLSPRRIYRLAKGDRRPVSGWTNYFHTWWWFTLIIILTAEWIFIGGGIFVRGFSAVKLLPIFSYILHQLIDAANRNTINSPLPISLAKYIPDGWRYETKLGKFL